MTKDGSQSMSVPEIGATYHSIHGAITESKHVFIEAGFNYINKDRKDAVKIFEMGFGTGLNALLSYLEAELCNASIYYETIDAYPLTPEEYDYLQYPSLIATGLSTFKKLHESPWGQNVSIAPFFVLRKERCLFEEFVTNQKFDLIYYDAFAPSVQPELWTISIFEKLFSMTKPGGILVTYCAKGDVRRAMLAAGFHVEKLKGPPGKREMLRAIVV